MHPDAARVSLRDQDAAARSAARLADQQDSVSPEDAADRRHPPDADHQFVANVEATPAAPAEHAAPDAAEHRDQPGGPAPSAVSEYWVLNLAGPNWDGASLVLGLPWEASPWAELPSQRRARALVSKLHCAPAASAGAVRKGSDPAEARAAPASPGSKHRGRSAASAGIPRPTVDAEAAPGAEVQRILQQFPFEVQQRAIRLAQQAAGEALRPVQRVPVHPYVLPARREPPPARVHPRPQPEPRAPIHDRARPDRPSAGAGSAPRRLPASWNVFSYPRHPTPAGGR